MPETPSSAENLENLWLIHESHQNLKTCKIVSEYLEGRVTTENSDEWVRVATASLAKLEAVVEAVNSLHANSDQCAHVTAASIVKLEAVAETVNSL